MGRPSHTRRLDLWMNGELVGHWSVSPRREELQYAASWLASPRARPISLSLPFQAGNAPHRGPQVRAYFENLLPDARDIRERLARRFNTASTEAFDLLEQIGRDCVGALQLVPAGSDPGDVRRIVGDRLSEADVERQLALATAPAARLGEADSEHALRVSIAGAQEKTALLRHKGRWMRPRGATPTTHILKLPLGLVGHLKLDMQDSVQNEWLCMQLLAAYGVPVPACEIAKFGGQVTLVVERFDRRLAPEGGWIMRLPVEDMCQATGTLPSRKYESDGGPGMNTILNLLRASRQAAIDRRTFLTANLLYWLLCATDGHAKNFSVFLLPGGDFRMTPVYDVLSAYPVLGGGANRVPAQRVKLAMAVRAKNAHWRIGEIHFRHWLAVAHRHGLEREFCETAVFIVEQTPAVIDAVGMKLPHGFPGYVFDAIVGGLKAGVDRFARMAAQERVIR